MANDNLDEILEKILRKMKEYADLKSELLEEKIKNLEKDFVLHKHNQNINFKT